VKDDRDYKLLLWGQFLGAFGDNFILKAILGPLTYELARGSITIQRVNAENALFSAVFFIPFIVLAPLVGFLNDRMPKTTWLFGGNLIKVLGTGLCLVGVVAPLGTRAHFWQVLGYTVVGLGACVYSPAKYGILPEILPAGRLVKANGWVEMLTLVAIVTGLIAGAALYDWTRSLPLCYLAALLLYGAALALNAAMKRTPCDPSARFRRSLAEFGGSLAGYVRHPRLGRILLGSGFFWFAGAVLRTNLQGWGIEVFRAADISNITNEKLVLLNVGLVVGIVSGAMLAGELHRTGDLSWSRRYGFLMAAAIAMLGWLGGGHGIAVVVAALVAVGIFGGLLLVPLNAALQAECDQSKLGKTVSIQNFTDYLSMLAGAGFLAAAAKFNLTPTQVFLALGVALALIAGALRLAVRKDA
jgi:MFS transporter, LPLT family, lysophospholipid transporter